MRSASTYNLPTLNRSPLAPLLLLSFAGERALSLCVGARLSFARYRGGSFLGVRWIFN